MVTLAKRATPSQARILKIVEGAVLNASDAHKVPRDTWLARSIAKRAAGTLTAQWPEVLAVNSRLPAKAVLWRKRHKRDAVVPLIWRMSDGIIQR